MTLNKVTQPLLILSQCFCLCPFVTKLEKNGYHFIKYEKTWFYCMRLVALNGIIIFAIIYRQCVNNNSNSGSVSTPFMQFAHYNCRIPGAFICVVFTNFFSSKVVEYMNDLKNLEASIKQIELKTNYKKAVNYGFITTVIACLKIFLLQIPYVFQGFYDNVDNVLDFIIFNLPLALIHVTVAQWMTYLYLLKINFESLNRILSTFKYRQCWVVQDFQKMKNLSNESTLKSCAMIYDHLCSAAKKVNGSFGWQFVFIFPGFFVETVLTSLNICQMMKYKVNFDGTTIVANILHFSFFLEVVMPCIWTKDEFVKFVNRLYKTDFARVDVEQAMDILTLQTRHQKVEFTANGVFSLDGTLIYSIFGALTTYLVILLQFDV